MVDKMGVWHIIKTNLKRSKGASTSMLCIVALTAFLIMTGITVLTQITSLYDRKSNELNSIHGAFWIKQNEFNESITELLSSDERVVDYEQEDVIFLNNARINYGGEYDSSTLIMNLDQERRISPVKLLEEDTSVPSGEAIYLPYYATMLGYTLGDPYTITYKQTTYTFRVAGFYESLEFTMANGKALKSYLDGKAFAEMERKLGTFRYTGFRCRESSQSIDVVENIKRNSGIKFDILVSTGNTVCDQFEIREGIMAPVSILAGLLLGVAFIIAAITLIFLRFRIVNSIEGNMHTFGALQSIGYTTQQIIASYLWEYGGIGFVGSSIGSFLAIFLFGPIERIMASMNGVWFRFRFDLGTILTLILVLTLLITGCTGMLCIKINKLTPVAALRGGISTHNFRKNYFSLDKGSGSPFIRIGMKNIMLYRKSYVMIAAILTGIGFILILCTNLYNSFVVDKMSFVQMTGIEVADVSITVTNQTDAKELAAEIDQMEEVRKTSMYDWISFTIEDMDVLGFCSDDFTKMETVPVYGGDYPQLDNEIAITGLLARQWGKQVGDSVSLKNGSVVKEYLITGFFSSMNNSGRAIMITLDGYHKVEPSYQRTGINVYLKEGYSYDAYTTRLKEQFGIVGGQDKEMSESQKVAEEKIAYYLEEFGINSVDYAVYKDGDILFSGSSMDSRIAQITNLKATAETQIGAYAAAVSSFVVLMFVIAALIVVMIVSMTVKNMLKKNIMQIGIQKAMGFETKELMLQYMVSFLPSIMIGTILGCVLGASYTNSLIAAMFVSMGVSHVAMIINLPAIFLVCVGIICGSCGVVLLFTWAIRKISVYALMTE